MAKGHKTGGRQKGTPNFATSAKVAEIAATGETPLDYMLRVMRDPTVDHERRDRNANSAAPYVHPKLAQIDANAKLNVDGSITFTWSPPED
jgi:hypothetical protein